MDLGFITSGDCRPLDGNQPRNVSYMQLESLQFYYYYLVTLSSPVLEYL